MTCLDTSSPRRASEAARVTMMPVRGGDDQRRHLRHDAVADGQQRVGGQRLAPAHAVLHHADHQAADDVHQDDEDAGDRVALDEPAGAVHRAVEVGFLLDLLAPLARLVLVDEAHVEIGVDAHLLAGHAVQREARRHLGDALRAVGHHHVLHDDQHQEHDQADDVVAADHVVADGGDHLAGVGFRQDQPRGRDVEAQAEQRRDQQQRRERRELQRPRHVERQQQDQQREGEVRDQQEVEQARRNRREQHQQDAAQQARPARARVCSPKKRFAGNSSRAPRIRRGRGCFASSSA